MNIDPRHLRVVLAITQFGTFARAADALGLSQPAVSKSVSLLERKLGAQLFVRGPRGSTPTIAGRIVARRAEGLEVLLSRVNEEIQAAKSQLDGPLKIGATPSMMLGLVPEALTRTLRNFPRLKAELREGLDETLALSLRCGEIDLAVGPVHGTGSLLDEVVETKLGEEELYVVLPPDHRFAGASTLSLASLKNEAWVLPNEGSFRQIVEALFISSGLQWPVNAIGTNRLQLFEQLVIQTDRLAILTTGHFLGRTIAARVIPLANAPKRLIGVKRRPHLPPSIMEVFFIEQLQRIFNGT